MRRGVVLHGNAVIQSCERKRIEWHHFKVLVLMSVWLQYLGDVHFIS